MKSVGCILSVRDSTVEDICSEAEGIGDEEHHPVPKEGAKLKDGIQNQEQFESE